MFIGTARKAKNYSEIFAADETALWLNPSGQKTIEERGAREVN
jgi:hypothetical protein